MKELYTNKEILGSSFTELLRKEYIGMKYGGREIVDVKVEIKTEYGECNDDGEGWEIDAINISVKTISPKGKNER